MSNCAEMRLAAMRPSITHFDPAKAPKPVVTYYPK